MPGGILAGGLRIPRPDGVEDVLMSCHGSPHTGSCAPGKPPEGGGHLQQAVNLFHGNLIGTLRQDEVVKPLILPGKPHFFVCVDIGLHAVQRLLHLVDNICGNVRDRKLSGQRLQYTPEFIDIPDLIEILICDKSAFVGLYRDQAG